MSPLGRVRIIACFCLRFYLGRASALGQADNTEPTTTAGRRADTAEHMAHTSALTMAQRGGPMVVAGRCVGSALNGPRRRHWP
jgi:hypothetical protein